jgi:hypothetical protein
MQNLLFKKHNDFIYIIEIINLSSVMYDYLKLSNGCSNIFYEDLEHLHNNYITGLLYNDGYLSLTEKFYLIQDYYSSHIFISNIKMVKNYKFIQLDEFMRYLLNTSFIDSNSFFMQLNDLNVGFFDQNGNFIKYRELNKKVYHDFKLYVIFYENVLYNYNIDFNKNFYFFNVFYNLFQYNIFEIKIFIKILPLVVSILGFFFYYFLDDRFFIFYHNNYYRFLFLKFFNGLFFDKLFIDVLLSKFYLFSYNSFYKNIESSFFQKYNIYIFEKNIYFLYFFFKIFSKGYFFIYILIVLFFIFFYFLFFIYFLFLNYYFLTTIILLFFYSNSLNVKKFFI